MVTSTFDLRSRKIDNVTSRYEVHLSTKYEVDPSIGLGGVRGHTHTHTHTHTDRHTHRGLTGINNIDFNFNFVLCMYLDTGQQ